MNKAEKIIHALKDHLNIKSDKELAAFFEIDVKKIYSWKKNGNITNTLRIYDKLRYLNMDWLETGTGPMAIIDKDNIHLIPSWEPPPELPPPPPERAGKIPLRIEPGNPAIKEELIERKRKAVEEKSSPVDEDLDLEEMKRMTGRVLESKTVYRSALASNVRAFYQAVQNEEEMQSTNDKLTAMADDIKRLTELVTELVGERQKREQKAG